MLADTFRIPIAEKTVKSHKLDRFLKLTFFSLVVFLKTDISSNRFWIFLGDFYEKVKICFVSFANFLTTKNEFYSNVNYRESA